MTDKPLKTGRLRRLNNTSLSQPRRKTMQDYDDSTILNRTSNKKTRQNQSRKHKQARGETKSKEEVKRIKQRDWNSKARRVEIRRQEKQTTRPKLKED